MYFLIIFLCLKREEQGKLLSDSDEYTDNGEILGKNDRKTVLIMQKILGKRQERVLIIQNRLEMDQKKEKRRMLRRNMPYTDRKLLCFLAFFLLLFLCLERNRKEKGE
mgnify:FL=1